MDEKLIRFFNKINYNDIAQFEDAKLVNMVINKKENTWLLNINAKEIIDIDAMIKLIKICNEGIDTSVNTFSSFIVIDFIFIHDISTDHWN